MIITNWKNKKVFKNILAAVFMSWFKSVTSDSIIESGKYASSCFMKYLTFSALVMFLFLPNEGCYFLF